MAVLLTLVLALFVVAHLRCLFTQPSSALRETESECNALSDKAIPLGKSAITAGLIFGFDPGTLLSRVFTLHGLC